jgi:hypothetical protein
MPSRWCPRELAKAFSILAIGLNMPKKQNTFEKRRRDMEKKLRADDKRRKRQKKKDSTDAAATAADVPQRPAE